MTCLWVNTSRKARRTGPAFSVRRFSGGRVSGWRKYNQLAETVPNTRKLQKIARQPNKLPSVAPSKGATAGTSTKIIIASDMMRAMWRPV